MRKSRQKDGNRNRDQDQRVKTKRSSSDQIFKSRYQTIIHFHHHPPQKEATNQNLSNVRDQYQTISL